MPPSLRLTITAVARDPRTQALQAAGDQLGITVPDELGIADVIHLRASLDAESRARLTDLLVDPLLQNGTWDAPSDHGIEVTPLPGVTDAEAAAVLVAARTLGIAVDAAVTGRRITFSADTTQEVARRFVERVVANPVVETWTFGTADPPLSPPADLRHPAERITVTTLSDKELAALSAERGLALDPEELAVIRDHFTAEGREPTDVELETLAQTWSEHCAHKTFRAVIDTEAGEREPLLRQLRDCTEEIDAPFVRSAFVGNAGVVEYVTGTTIALKAETHNHPSAIEPFGGANTGVGGVIRDVLGIAHRPIAVTDILCFGPRDLALDAIPEGALHPLRISEGVVDGVADYGNKIGLPTVAGAVLYDPAYTTNPLVFAGCIGTAEGWTSHDGPHPGDRVIVLGGRTGRDGIRGATFSSATMDATTGEVAGASVQIGDPITEKLLIDALVGAEELFTAITDCGAGGLSSAVGEMAEGVGADVDLDRVPLKYAGLEPWEIWLSEAQERMVIAVAPERVEAMRSRCDRFGVEFSDIGEFTGTGRLVVRCAGETVVDLDTEFLHDGRPQRRLPADLPRPVRTEAARQVDDPAAVLLDLLAHPNLRSRADIIHRYDHEIRGTTVVRPITGVERDAPADGVVLAEPRDQHGVAIGIGVNPWHGLADPERMGWSVVDEAIRNVVAVGADPDRISLLDNFSFGDPRRRSTMGDLVASVDGCVAASRAFAAPFVSGKDSLNNEYTASDGSRHAVPPTLVITAVAHVPDVARTITPRLRAAGDTLVLLGTTRAEFAGSHLDMVRPHAGDLGCVPAPDAAAPQRYRSLHAAILAGEVVACHDLSEGGLALAAAEMCIAGRLGARLDNVGHDDVTVGLFSESMGRLLVEVAPQHVDSFLERFGDDATVIGAVTDDGLLRLAGESIPVEQLVTAHTGDPR
ncbi:MAG: phosphoribosylformylglycinamidine synthase subunit PurL [Ilumatobacteraceae bacterium]